MRFSLRVGLILLFLVGAAVSAAAFALRGLSPQDLRSLTKEQYDQALARWRSQGVTEYEMVVDYKVRGPYAGMWTLNVHGNQVDIISPTLATLSTYLYTPPTGPDLKFLTVEGMFADIERNRKALTSADSEQALELNDLDYYVRFDSSLGYPTLYETQPHRGVFDMDWHIRVESLKILQHVR